MKDFTDIELATRFLDVIEFDIIPLTEIGVARGDKIFGAAILRKDDLSLVIAETNKETQNPLFHGEISTLNGYFTLPREQRPCPRDCLFLSTHEPCSLCLSAITWSGFDNFYYLYGYIDTRDAFHIPHDLKILSEVFRIQNGNYSRKNHYWKCRSIDELSIGMEKKLGSQRKRIDESYSRLSSIYQDSEGHDHIPLS